MRHGVNELLSISAFAKIPIDRCDKILEILISAGDVLIGTTLSISDVSQAEGNSVTTAFIFTVTSSNSLKNDVNVNYATANGSATAGSDYQTTSGMLIIPAGQTSKTITVNVTGDTTKEPDEAFFVDLSLPGGATIAKAQGIGTIINLVRSSLINRVTPCKPQRVDDHRHAQRRYQR